MRTIKRLISLTCWQSGQSSSCWCASPPPPPAPAPACATAARCWPARCGAQGTGGPGPAPDHRTVPFMLPCSILLNSMMYVVDVILHLWQRVSKIIAPTVNQPINNQWLNELMYNYTIKGRLDTPWPLVSNWNKLTLGVGMDTCFKWRHPQPEVIEASFLSVSTFAAHFSTIRYLINVLDFNYLVWEIQLLSLKVKLFSPSSSAKPKVEWVNGALWDSNWLSQLSPRRTLTKYALWPNYFRLLLSQLTCMQNIAGPTNHHHKGLNHGL